MVEYVINIFFCNLVHSNKGKENITFDCRQPYNDLPVEIKQFKKRIEILNIFVLKFYVKIINLDNNLL